MRTSKTKKEAETAAKRKKTAKDLSEVAGRFSAFRPAREVLRSVSAVPTCFASFDHATRVGGLPIERFMLVHGPSNHGKTVFALGLMKSFLERNHFAAFVDAEYTTPTPWVETLFGTELANSDRFLALQPTSYEQTVDGVRDLTGKMVTMRAEGIIDPDTSCLIVVDSIRKLVPEKLMEKIMKGASEHGIDGMGGRGAQIRAAMNAAWLDELTPRLAASRCAMIVIARETEDPDATANDKKYGKGTKVGGGKALYYDSSLVMRVERAGWVYPKSKEESKGDADEDKGQQAIGEKHRVTITKTKVAQKEDRQQVAYFHTSNGVLSREGYEPARDLLMMGERFGIITRKGAWYLFEDHKWQGGQNTVEGLNASPSILSHLERKVREQFSNIEPLEHDEDGVVT